jgi:importin subunit beta-1
MRLLLKISSMKLIQLLEMAQSSNTALRQEAEAKIEVIEKENFIDFCLNLSKILCEKKNKSEIRRLSGLILKNKISINKEIAKRENGNNWLNFSDGLRKSEIKENVLKVLGEKDKHVRRVSSQILAQIVLVELSEKLYTGLIDNFFFRLQSSNFEENLYHGTLEIFQFILQEFRIKNFNSEIIDKLSDIVSKLVFPLISQESHEFEELKIGALHTFISSVELFEKKLEITENRDYILKLICNQLISRNDAVLKLSFEIFEKLIMICYDHFENFISFIFESSLFLIFEGSESACLSAIEFWSTVAEKEFEINIISLQALNEGRVSPIHSRNFIKKISKFYTEYILKYIKLKIKNRETDEWNCYNSAGVSLNLMSQAAPSEIIENVLTFSNQNLTEKACSISIESSFFAFITIFDGIGPKILYGKVSVFLKIFVEYLKNGKNQIFKLASWAIGKICTVGSFFIRKKINVTIQFLFLYLIKKEIFENSSWSLNEISIGFGKEGVLSWCFNEIFCSIFQILSRGNRENKNELFEISGSFILNSSVREKSTILTIFPLIFKFFKENVASKNYPMIEEQENANFILRFINIIIQKFGKNFGGSFCICLLEYFHNLISEINKSPIENILDEEILIFLGISIQGFLKKHPKYLENWVPFVLQKIKPKNNEQILSLAIGVIGDICRAIGAQFKPYLEQTLQVLIYILQNENENIKPIILACLGDIAFTTEDSSWKYFNFSIPLFKAAANFTKEFFDVDDLDKFENRLQLKESILEGISSVIQNTRIKDNFLQINEKLDWIFVFLGHIMEEDRTQRISFLTIGLIGDLSQYFLNFKKTYRRKKWIHQILFEFENSDNEKSKNLGEWVKESLKLKF